MHLDYAFVCDRASIDARGKISAEGIGWDTIVTTGLPAIHSSFFFVARFSGSPPETGDKPANVTLMDDDGNLIAAAGGPLRFILLDDRPACRADLILELPGVVFPRFGFYSLILTIHGIEMARATFRVLQGTEPPQAQA